MVLVDSLDGLSLWDWGIVFLLTVSTLVSIWRGFSREAISLLGWVFSFVIANLYAGAAAISLESVIDNVMARLLVSWLLIFIVVLLTTTFFSKIFSKSKYAKPIIAVPSTYSKTYERDLIKNGLDPISW